VLVPRALQAMKAKSPQLRVFLDGLLRVQHMDYLIRGQGECIVTLAELDHSLAMGRTIASAPLVALLPRNHPLASKDRLAPVDFAQTEIIAFEHNGPHSIAIDSFFAASNTAPNVCAYVRFADIAVALAAQNVGVALVDDFTVQDVVPEGLVKRRLVGAPQFTARLYWNGERPGSRHVDQLGDALIAAMVAD
jgi:DNA-binding transcriptional LysR family regulator